MATVFVSLGSNINPDVYLQRGIDELGNVLASLVLSTVYRSAAKGFDGPDFLNAVCRGETSLSPEQLAAKLKEIEHHCDRDRSAERFSSRTLDLDLLLYDEQIIEQRGLQIPRAEILEEAFVLQPLVDLAAPQLHPGDRLEPGSAQTTVNRAQTRGFFALAGVACGNVQRIFIVSAGARTGLERPAAINRDDLPGNVVCLFTAQKADQVGDVLRGAVATHWDFICDLLLGIRIERCITLRPEY